MAMNTGFAAYLAKKKAGKTQPTMQPVTPQGVPSGMMMGGQVQVKTHPKGKRHSKISIKMKGK